MIKLNRIIEAFEDFEDDQVEEVVPNPQPEVVEPQEVKPSQNVIENAVVDQVNNLTTQAWDLVTNLHATTATFEAEQELNKKEELLTTLQNITDQVLIVIGMLNNAMAIVDPQLMDIINNQNTNEVTEQ